jgi:hypothetical protein
MTKRTMRRRALDVLQDDLDGTDPTLDEEYIEYASNTYGLDREWVGNAVRYLRSHEAKSQKEKDEMWTRVH